MSSNGSTNYANGVLYSYSTTLACGAHSYYFNASDGTTTNQTAQVAGPYVNCAPVLSSGQVFPTFGNTLTLLNYTVTYTDTDNEAPTTVYVMIDSTPRKMTGTSAAYSSGAIYYLNTTLSTTGTHNFYFNATDGNYTVATSLYGNPRVYTDTPACSGVDPAGESDWTVNAYTDCTNTAVLPTSTHTGILNITGGNILNLTSTQVYINNTRIILDGRLLLDGSTISFIR